MRALVATASFLWLLPAVSAAQAGEPAPGFRMYGPHGSTETILVDRDGVIVHTWDTSYFPGNGMYQLENGELLRSGKEPGKPGIGGAGGNVQRATFDGTILWEYAYGTSEAWGHHDIKGLPNGNVLMIAWDLMSGADAIALGRDPAITGDVWYPDSAVEIEPSGATGGTIVWEWHMRDHLIQDFDATKPGFGDVGANPQLLDINFPAEIPNGGSWNHVNSIDYDAENDLILLNFSRQDEFYLIDHSTTTAEAAGHAGGNYGKGGDLLYRWGNPQAYRAGDESDRKLFNQHGTKFILDGLPGGGNVIVFNNQYGSQFGMDYSAVHEVDIPDPAGGFSLLPDGTYAPATYAWEYTAPTPTDFYSGGLSNAERLPNGNTLIDSGRQMGWLFEVTTTGAIVWEYFNQIPTANALVFQVSYYERTLWSNKDSVSTSAGGTVDYDIVAGSRHAGSLYQLLGSLSGTEPGLLPGGHVLPLNPDAYFFYTLNNPNSPILPGTAGTLDALGNATASTILPPGLASSFVGITAHHAFGVLDPVTMEVQLTSNAVSLELLP